MHDRFIQHPPQLANQYEADPVLREYLQRQLPADYLDGAMPDFLCIGELAAGELYALQQADREQEPRLVQWDAWGQRIDAIELTDVWHRAEPLAAETGLIAHGYDTAQQPWGRIRQFALAYLFIPSTDMYGCPLAMTDGAASALLASGNQNLIDRAVPRLTSRDPDRFWTSGQWMTETTGGSDVSGTETRAQQDDKGQWRLYGKKWFTSAATAQMALALARPDGNPSGSGGLALFYLEPRDALGKLQCIEVLRLKQKLGTRKLPTTELLLNGAPATPVGKLTDGVKQIAPMLNITRTWNAVTAVAYMRRGLALAQNYAGRRRAFGHLLADLPLHQQTLADLQAEYEGAFQLAFSTVALLGRVEQQKDPAQAAQLRLRTALTKLYTAKQAIRAVSEILECLGGAGYLEDTGIPVLLRDVQVLSIWEGTTNVLALEALDVLRSTDALAQETDSLLRIRGTLVDPALQQILDRALAQFDQLRQYLDQQKPEVLQANARRVAYCLAQNLACASLSEQAQWSLQHAQSRRARYAAERFAKRHQVPLSFMPLDQTRALAAGSEQDRNA